MEKNKKANSTQSFLKVSEIRSDTLITEDGAYVAIIAVSSTNFALKSQEEQNALIAGYQNFLNSLDFSVQILMQSRKMDISSYLDKLNKLMEQQTNELLRVQTSEYIEFISKLVDNASIMNKSFYIIIPYYPGFSGIKKPGSGGFFSFFKKKDASYQAKELEENIQEFKQNRVQLDQHVNTVISGLASIGLKSIPLQTEEITELVYSSYNFDVGPSIDASKLSEVKLK